MMKFFNPSQNEASYFFTEKAIFEMQNIVWPKIRKTRRLSSFLMNLYITKPLNKSQRNNIYKLLIIISKRGIDANVKCISRRSFAFYAYHFKMVEVIDNLKNINKPNAYAGIQLIGFFGGFIKSVINKKNGFSSSKSNSLYREEYFLDSDKIPFNPDVKINDVLRLINSISLKINLVDIKKKYKFSPTNEFFSQKNHIIHTAVVNYNLPALKNILNQGANPLIVNPHKRNILHLAEIVDAFEIKKYILNLPKPVVESLRKGKDFFGKTPDDICRNKMKKSNDCIDKNQGFNSGGWNEIEAEKWTTNKSDIEIISNDKIDCNVLISDYISIQKPVLIKNAIQRVPHLLKLFEKQNFESVFGQTIVSSGEIPYSSTYNKKENRGEYSKLTRGINDYVFCQLDQKKDRRLISEFSNFDLISKIKNQNWQFYSGPKESGAPMHVHTNAWNLLIYGKKRWIIAPPLEGVYSTQHIRKWLKNNKKEFMEFTQEAGDFVYIPRYWSHGVINIRESIGVATEFTSKYIY